MYVLLEFTGPPEEKSNAILFDRDNGLSDFPGFCGVQIYRSPVIFENDSLWKEEQRNEKQLQQNDFSRLANLWDVHLAGNHLDCAVRFCVPKFRGRSLRRGESGSPDGYRPFERFEEPIAQECLVSFSRLRLQAPTRCRCAGWFSLRLSHHPQRG